MKLESHGQAWSRLYNIRKAGHWGAERDGSLRMRGYTELVMHRINSRIRKKINSALRRGYKLDRKMEFFGLLNLICHHNPIQPIDIGYIGKTRMDVWLPTLEEALDLLKELQAQTVMTEAMDGSKLNHTATPSDQGYYEVWVRRWLAAGGKGSSDQPQLKSQMSELRVPIDEWMEKDAPIREEIARWCACDDSIIRVPFDTHREEND